jgi:hypothetical protein
MQHHIWSQITPPIDRPCFNWIIGAAFQVAQSFQVSHMSTATLSAPTKTRTARQPRSTRTLSTLIAAELQVAPIDAPAALSSPWVAEPAPAESTTASLNAASPAIVLVVAFLAVVAMASAVCFVARIVWAAMVPIARKALSFAQCQLGSQTPPQSWIELKDLLGHS